MFVSRSERSMEGVESLASLLQADQHEGLNEEMETEQKRLYSLTLLPFEEGTHAHITLSGRRRLPCNFDNGNSSNSTYRKTAEQVCAVLANAADNVTRVTLPMLHGYDWILLCEAVESHLKQLKEVSIFLGKGEEFEDGEDSAHSGQEADQLEFLLSRLPAGWSSLALKSLWRRQNAQDFRLLEILSNFPQLKQLELFMFRREFSMEHSILLGKALGRIESIQTLSMSGFKFESQEAWNIVEEMAFLTCERDSSPNSKKLVNLERLELCRCAHSTILKINFSDELVFALSYQQAKRVYYEEVEKHRMLGNCGSTNLQVGSHRLALIEALSHAGQRTDCQFGILRFCIDPALWAVNGNKH